MKKMITALLVISVLQMQAQNVGIGTNSPGFPLNFSNSTGDKISLFGNSGAHYGLGIQSALLQIHASASGENIAFGYGSSASFTERVRIINSGMDGMNVKGRLHIMNGSSPLNAAQTGGVWLYKADNSALLGFVGTQNNQNVGFYGGPVNGGWGFVYDAVNSRVGIGTSDPGFPLNFADVTGDKISLYGNSGAHYGFGIQGGLLQIHSGAIGDDIAFGYGSSASFTERMRIKGSGNVGIGLNGADPTNRLTVKSTDQAVSSFEGPDGAYITLAENGVNKGYIGSYLAPNSANDVDFGTFTGNTTGSVHLSTALVPRLTVTNTGNIGIGTSSPNAALQLGNVASNRRIVLWETSNNDNEYYGFGINGGTLRYQVNNTFSDHAFYAGTSATASTELLRIKGNGAISVNGNTGQAGQVLASNGTSGAPVWKSIGDGRSFVARPSNFSPDVVGGATVDVPGMVANFTLPAPSQVVFHYKLVIQNRGCVACGERRTFISLVQNVIGGTNDIESITVYTPNYEYADGVSGPIVLDLQAGTYSFKISLSGSIYGAATVYSQPDGGILTWQIFPN